MPRNMSAYIEEILGAISEINSFLKNMDFETYLNDSKTKSAVERKLMIIGEAMNQMHELNPQVENKITDFRKIIAFRNIIVHGYFGIDDQLVWDILQKKLSRLEEEMRALI